MYPKSFKRHEDKITPIHKRTAIVTLKFCDWICEYSYTLTSFTSIYVLLIVELHTTYYISLKSSKLNAFDGLFSALISYKFLFYIFIIGKSAI